MELMTSYERRGIEKGKEQGIKQVALNLLSDGMDVQKVVELTGLTEPEVKELKNQQND
ncbi:transposase [Salicibibacter halophilus]|uniref:Transposase n=1 Tax=Salicibibacter halophilus TaxID=2502791 RepID=A0A514LJB7_9BACI|nr:transposase [Salicibibacter halophilus]QDI91946.1 transposase [Salicibibacter halophilus]